MAREEVVVTDKRDGADGGTMRTQTFGMVRIPRIARNQSLHYS